MGDGDHGQILRSGVCLDGETLLSKENGLPIGHAVMQTRIDTLLNSSPQGSREVELLHRDAYRIDRVDPQLLGSRLIGMRNSIPLKHEQSVAGRIERLFQLLIGTQKLLKLPQNVLSRVIVLEGGVHTLSIDHFVLLLSPLLPPSSSLRSPAKSSVFKAKIFP